MWSFDVKLVSLSRHFFIESSVPEFELRPEESFELLKPLYALSDAGELWHLTLDKQLTERLGLEPTKADPSLYFSLRRGELIGTNRTYVDDFYAAELPNFGK